MISSEQCQLSVQINAHSEMIFITNILPFRYLSTAEKQKSVKEATAKRLKKLEDALEKQCTSLDFQKIPFTGFSGTSNNKLMQQEVQTVEGGIP